MRALPILLPALLLGCSSVEGKLKDLSWGSSFDAEYADTVDRAKQVVLREFPNGFDPDRTNEEAGDLWTIWHYKESVWYRKTIRWRARIKVDRAGEGKVRLGISVVRQLNDNIDNPHDVQDARWVKTERDPDTASRMEQAIARRYLDPKPSEYFEDKYKGKRGTMRRDLIDRSKDVDLSAEPDPEKDTHEFPKLEKDD